ncbi:MAG: hypothetical protein JSR37_09885 [Verrucomicrobia bacterium]|nr:hypothetical protein [Verrucomicrobiota bacterium]MBS0636894.1 hypothetical protein [Verrucomicrobiota bacterium]
MNSDMYQLQGDRGAAPQAPGGTVSSPLLNRAKEGLNTLKGRLLSKRTSQKEVQPIQDSVEAVLKQGEARVMAVETVTNRCKNINVLDLSLTGQTRAQDLADRLMYELSDFKKAHDEGRSGLPKVLGRDVPAADINVLKKFIGELLADPDGCKVLWEVIQRKDDLLHKRAFLSSSVLKAIMLMKTAEEAALIANHLMSECTMQAGPYRIVKIEAFDCLLQDNRLQDLRYTLQQAAQSVMRNAIRKCQSTIVFDALAKRPEWQDSLKSWEEMAKSLGDTYLDISGISDIARAARIPLIIVAAQEKEEQMKMLLDIYKSLQKIQEK